MLANSIKTEKKLQMKSVEMYLKRITRLLRREEVCRQRARENDQAEGTVHKPATWNQKGDPMDLDKIEIKQSRKCFKCEKPGHIRRFYKERILATMESENKKLLTTKGSQKEDL